MSIRRLSDVELFHVRGAEGLEPISDETLSRRLDAAERRALQGYAEAVSEEMLRCPEAVCTP